MVEKARYPMKRLSVNAQPGVVRKDAADGKSVRVNERMSKIGRLGDAETWS